MRRAHVCALGVVPSGTSLTGTSRSQTCASVSDIAPRDYLFDIGDPMADFDIHCFAFFPPPPQLDGPSEPQHQALLRLRIIRCAAPPSRSSGMHRLL